MKVELIDGPCAYSMEQIRQLTDPGNSFTCGRISQRRRPRGPKGSKSPDGASQRGCEAGI